jgi:hypothetical protein
MPGPVASVLTCSGWPWAVRGLAAVQRESSAPVICAACSGAELRVGQFRGCPWPRSGRCSGQPSAPHSGGQVAGFHGHQVGGLDGPHLCRGQRRHLGGAQGQRCLRSGEGAHAATFSARICAVLSAAMSATVHARRPAPCRRPPPGPWSWLRTGVCPAKPGHSARGQGVDLGRHAQGGHLRGGQAGELGRWSWHPSWSP